MEFDKKQLTPRDEFVLLMRRCKYSQQMCADIFGISQSAISQIRRGLIPVTEKRLSVLRRALLNPRRELLRQLRLRSKVSQDARDFLAQVSGPGVTRR